MQILIIGASGYLGRHVYSDFVKRYEVIGTYCTNRTDQRLIQFNLNTDNMECLGNLMKSEDKCAIICAAESKFDACKLNSAESFQTNVSSTIELIKKLKQMNYYIIFCSTDSVFDGVKGNYTETDKTCPVNEYGETKRQVEQFIMQYCPNDCIFRLSKLVGSINNPKDTFCEWKNMAMEKKDIYCIKDNFFSPVDVEDVANCMELACHKRLGGVYHICGNEVYSRVELCRSFLHAMNLKAFVYEKKLEDFGFYANRPLNVGMSNKKASTALLYKFKNMEEVYIRYKCAVGENND